MKKKLTAVKDHVHHYRARYAVASTLTVCVALQSVAAKQWNEFLSEHNLLDSYYYSEEN